MDINLKNKIIFNNDWQSYLKIRVIPKSNKTEIIGFMDDWSLKIRIKSVPEQWKANKELKDFLINILDLNDAEIVSWKNDRVKLVRLISH